MNSVMKKLIQAGTHVNVLLCRRVSFLNLEATASGAGATFRQVPGPDRTHTADSDP